MSPYPSTLSHPESGIPATPQSAAEDEPETPTVQLPPPVDPRDRLQSVQGAPSLLHRFPNASAAESMLEAFPRCFRSVPPPDRNRSQAAPTTSTCTIVRSRPLFHSDDQYSTASYPIVRTRSADSSTSSAG